jgi:hypothetical protein
LKFYLPKRIVIPKVYTTEPQFCTTYVNLIDV